MSSSARRVVGKLAPGYAQPGDLADPLRGIEAAMLRYRVMAYVVGTGLATLVFVGIPLQYGAGMPQIDEYVGTAHGILYIVYLLVAVDLARRARFTLLQMAAMVGAGFVPLLAFVIEHRVTTRLRRELDTLRPFVDEARSQAEVLRRGEALGGPVVTDAAEPPPGVR